MSYDEQLRIERLIVSGIAIGAVVGAVVLAYWESEMNGLTVLFTVGGILVTLAGIAILAARFCQYNAEEESQISELERQHIEDMRRILERETGREIAIVYRESGHWHAVTARGSVPVSELLKSGYVRVGGERK